MIGHEKMSCTVKLTIACSPVGLDRPLNDMIRVTAVDIDWATCRLATPLATAVARRGEGGYRHAETLLINS